MHYHFPSTPEATLSLKSSTNIIVRLGPVTAPPICHISPPLQQAGMKLSGVETWAEILNGYNMMIYHSKAKLLPIRFYSQLNLQDKLQLLPFAMGQRTA
ncbi:uncharacterized [Tachysurus ichikawai]